MQNWTIDFQGMDGTRKLRGTIEERLAELAQRHGATSTCRVIVKGPQASKRSKQYELEIHLTLADGSDIKIGRSQRNDSRYEEVGFAIDDTFRRARRRLKDHFRGRAVKSKQLKSTGPAPPAAAPSVDAFVSDAANQKESSIPAEAAGSTTTLPPASDSPAELPEAVVSDDALSARDELTSDVGQEPMAAEVVADETEEPAFQPDAAADQRDELTRDVGQGPMAAEVAANETEEPALARDAAADLPAGTASESADGAVSPSAEPGQAPNLNPLFVALAVGTALTAAATLNASANWARLLKNVAEGKSGTADDIGESSEAQPGAGGDLQSGSD